MLWPAYHLRKLHGVNRTRCGQKAKRRKVDGKDGGKLVEGMEGENEGERDGKGYRSQSWQRSQWQTKSWLHAMDNYWRSRPESAHAARRHSFTPHNVDYSAEQIGIYILICMYIYKSLCRYRAAFAEAINIHCWAAYCMELLPKKRSSETADMEGGCLPLTAARNKTIISLIQP